eukprot:scaffold2752_cov62-Phaeocystis_antarctica.AAC.2
MPRICLAKELRCECRLVRGVLEGASDAVHAHREVSRRRLEVRVVLAPGNGAGEERTHQCASRSGTRSGGIAKRAGSPATAVGGTCLAVTPASLQVLSTVRWI